MDGQGDTGSPSFPVGLLLTGYGTACLAALALLLLGAGEVTALLTVWLGGALATLTWGGLRASPRILGVPVGASDHAAPPLASRVPAE